MRSRAVAPSGIPVVPLGSRRAIERPKMLRVLAMGSRRRHPPWARCRAAHRGTRSFPPPLLEAFWDARAAVPLHPSPEQQSKGSCGVVREVSRPELTPPECGERLLEQWNDLQETPQVAVHASPRPIATASDAAQWLVRPFRRCF